MRKNVSLAIILAIVLVLVLSVSTAGAATRKIALLRAEVEAGTNGAVFYFRVYGDFPKYEGTVYFGNKATKLNCNLQDNDKTLICRMDRGVPGIGGKVVTVEVNGFGFYPLVEITATCLPIYDWAGFTPGPWSYYGDYCQMEAFEENKTYFFDNPFWGESPYNVSTGGYCGPDGSWNDYGVGLYYPWCQGLN